MLFLPDKGWAASTLLDDEIYSPSVPFLCQPQLLIYFQPQVRPIILPLAPQNQRETSKRLLFKELRAQ